MEREFLFDEYHTWTDWKLLLTEKNISVAEVKTNYMEMDGASDPIDLSEVLSGEPVYGNRTIYASFFTDEGSYDDRTILLSCIVNRIHGRKVKIVEPDNLEHYFLGRITVKSTHNYPTYAQIEVEAICAPWRYEHEETVNFFAVDSDVAEEFTLCNSGRKTICPDITVTGSITVTCNGVTTSMTDGSYKIATFKLFGGENIIGLSGSGTLTLKYRRATL